MGKTLRNLDHRALIATLRTIRHERKISQKYLAKKLRKAPSWVSKVEGGEVQLKVPEYMEWARVLRLTPSKLMLRVERMRAILL
jgi:transcriptional regulator with XRE-family HTH domain